MSRPILEVIALDEDDARAAREGGADRLELVTDMAADGLTPARETFARVRAAVELPVRVMLRGSAGFTAGGAAALDALRAQARALRAEGADEFVLGFLDAEGGPDLHAITALTDVLGHCPWTFHRAIDHAADRARLRKTLEEFTAPGHGPDAYLTAGSPAGVDEGMGVLCSEAATSAAYEPGHGPTVVAGGGLRLRHVAPLAAAGVTAFHIGTAARPTGWSGPADSRLVREWREALDA